MPSTYLLQQMVAEDPKEQRIQHKWKKSPEEVDALLSLEVLGKFEIESPGRVRKYIEEVLEAIPTDKDQRYVRARLLYNNTKDLPRTHDALRVILYHL